jgi:hypothetical protein
VHRSACEAGQRFQHLSLAKFFLRPLNPLAIGNVADVALNHPLSAYAIDVADKLYLNELACLGLQRKIFITDIFPMLQFPKSSPACFDISEGTDLPEFFPQDS